MDIIYQKLKEKKLQQTLSSQIYQLKSLSVEILHRKLSNWQSEI